MKAGDLVRINCRGSGDVWVYRGRVFGAAIIGGRRLSDGTLGLHLGPSDLRFPLGEPSAILVGDQIWTLSSTYLETIDMGTV